LSSFFISAAYLFIPSNFLDFSYLGVSMTSVGTETQQPTSLDTTSHQNQMEAVFGESYTFASNDQERDQAATQAELVAAAVAAAANSANGTSNYHTLVASADPSNNNVIATATAQKMEDVNHTTELVKRELANQKVWNESFFSAGLFSACHPPVELLQHSVALH
jgi:hypothetical protein